MIRRLVEVVLNEPRYRRTRRLLSGSFGLNLGCGPSHYRNKLNVDIAALRGLSVRTSACSLPFRSGVFPEVICEQMLEHVPDRSRALQEISRVLSRDGRLIMSVPCRNWLGKLDSRLLHAGESHEGFSPEEIRMALAKAGLHVQDCFSYGFMLFFLGLLRGPGGSLYVVARKVS